MRHPDYTTILNQANSDLVSRKDIAAKQRSRPLILGGCFAVTLLAAAATSWMVRAQPAPEKPLEGKLESSREEPLAPQYKLGRELYIKNCSYCHLVIPPEVFPSDTWRALLLDSYHYGRQVQIDFRPEKLLVWQYLRDYSRALQEKEPVPYYFAESRYFRALHPKVPLPKRPNTASCLPCHPGAKVGNYLRLSAEWEEKP